MTTDRLSVVREVYHTSDDPNKVRRAWLLAERIVARRMSKARSAAERRGDFRWPFPQVTSA